MALSSTTIKWHGKRVFTLATRANIAAMKKAGFVVERNVKELLSKRGTGRTYIRGKKRHSKQARRHVASAPGQPPAVDTGILRASIFTDVSVKGGNVVGKVGPDVEHIAAEQTAGTDVEYGLFLELGTAKMAARPFLRPGLAKSAAQIVRIFKGTNK